MDYLNKYLKYKNKYFNLKKQIGGVEVCPNFNKGFFDLEYWNTKIANMDLSLPTHQVIFANNDRQLPKPVVDGPYVLNNFTPEDNNNFIIFILGYLLGTNYCADGVTAKWLPYIIDPNKKIYIIDLNNFMYQFNKYYWPNIKKNTFMDVHAMSAYEWDEFKREYSQRMLLFIYNKVFVKNEMVIIIDKKMSADMDVGIDSILKQNVNDPLFLPIMSKLNINLIISKTSYINYTTKKELAMSGSCDDYIFWLIVMGIVNMITNLNPDPNFINITNKIRLLTNDGQNIGISPDENSCIPQQVTKTIFSDLFIVFPGENSTIADDTKMNRHTTVGQQIKIKITYLDLDINSQQYNFQESGTLNNYCNVITSLFMFDTSPKSYFDNTRLSMKDTANVYCDESVKKNNQESILDLPMDKIREYACSKLTFHTLIRKIQKLVYHTSIDKNKWSYNFEELGSIFRLILD